VEIGRLRGIVATHAAIHATARGYIVAPRGDRAVTMLAPPIDGEQGELVALLADGTAWSTSGLALALGLSQRSIQRSLAELELDGRVRAVGQTRARRWLAPTLTGFTTILLLPGALPIR
jgi:predicted Rossmann fold nucleotide-binding protein DprA/Smf involved in DNA uptake